jgi:hypothetical protein
VSAPSLPRARLAALLPALLDGQTLVLLVPASDRGWCARAAWDVARAAALGSRRVALVDLRLDDPSLHEPAGVTPTDGIVDAFEFEVSLTRTAHEVDGVFFIAVGSDTADPSAIIAQPRWRRLHAGFRAEGALLLLYVSAGAAARLGAQPDGVIILARDGTAARLAPELPLIGVVREGDPPAPPAPPAPAGPRPARRLRPAWLAGGLALAGALGWSLVAMAREPRMHPLPPTPAVALTAADSTPWTIQLAAYTTPDRAVSAADRHAARGVPVFVSPVSLDASAAIWYRVLAGGYATRDAAAAARIGLWRDGLATRGEGALLRAPYSFRLTPHPASVPPDSLKRLGLVGRPWGQPGSSLLGAFETPEQGSFAAAALRRAGLDIALVTRTGTTP